MRGIDPTDDRVHSRRHWAAAALLLALHAFLAWRGRPPGIVTGQDDAFYLLLSRSLLAGGYHEIFRVDTPIHQMYPPGYPALLAFWSTLGSDRFDWLVTASVLSSTAALLAVYDTVRRLWSPVFALACLAALCVNPFLVSAAGSLASESPYLFFSMLALWLASGTQPSSSALVLAIAAGSAAALTRSVGVTLLAALGAYLVLQRRLKLAAGLTVLSLATVGAWLLWTLLAPGKFTGVSYVGDLNRSVAADGVTILMVIEKVLLRIPRYLVFEVPLLFSAPTVRNSPVDNVLTTIFLTTCIVAGTWVFFRKWRLAALYVLAYTVLLALWPFRVHRFLVPLIPLLVPAFLLGVCVIATRVRARWGLPATVCGAVLVTAVCAAQTMGLLSSKPGCAKGQEPPATECLSRDQRSFFAALSYVRASLPQDAVFLTAKPATFYYYTGRLTVARGLAFAQDSASFQRFLRERGVEYVLLGRLHGGEITRVSRLMRANCHEFLLEKAFPPRTFLFRLPETAPAAGDDSACRAMEAYSRRGLSDAT